MKEGLKKKYIPSLIFLLIVLTLLVSKNQLVFKTIYGPQMFTNCNPIPPILLFNRLNKLYSIALITLMILLCAISIHKSVKIKMKYSTNVFLHLTVDCG